MGQRHPMLTCMLQCCAQCYVASSLSTQTFCKFYRGCWQRETYLKGDSGGQMHMDKECPFSSVTDYGRVWMKGARQQALECFGITTSLGGRRIWIRSAPSAVSLITAEFGWRVPGSKPWSVFSITVSMDAGVGVCRHVFICQKWESGLEEQGVLSFCTAARLDPFLAAAP